MVVVTFKVTEKKLKEILGKVYLSYMNPRQDKEFKIGLFVFCSLFIVTLVSIPFYQKTLPRFGLVAPTALTVIGSILSVIYLSFIPGTYFVIRAGAKKEVIQKIKRLVNDQELFWLNFHIERTDFMPINKEMEWKRASNTLTPENFLAMAYLKKEGGSQGIYKKILRWKNSNSAKKNLERLAARGVIIYDGGDFRYGRWQFKLINENGQFLETTESKRAEELLDYAWEMMLRTELKNEERDE